MSKKSERVHALVNAGPWPGMSEAFDAHMGAACWTDPSYAQDASMWAAAWKTSAELLRAALDQKQAEYEDLQRHGNNTAHNLARVQAALARLEAAVSRSDIVELGTPIWHALDAAQQTLASASGPNVAIKPPVLRSA